MEMQNFFLLVPSRKVIAFMLNPYTIEKKGIIYTSIEGFSLTHSSIINKELFSKPIDEIIDLVLKNKNAKVWSHLVFTNQTEAELIKVFKSKGFQKEEDGEQIRYITRYLYLRGCSNLSFHDERFLNLDNFWGSEVFK